MWQKTALLGYTSDANCICWCARNQLYLITALMQNASAGVPETSFAWSYGCDVLYANASVETFANAVPKLLNKTSGTLLLADPSDRTKENRYASTTLKVGSSQQRLLCFLSQSQL